MFGSAASNFLLIEFVGIGSQIAAQDLRIDTEQEEFLLDLFRQFVGRHGIGERRMRASVLPQPHGDLIDADGCLAAASDHRQCAHIRCTIGENIFQPVVEERAALRVDDVVEKLAHHLANLRALLWRNIAALISMARRVWIQQTRLPSVLACD